MRMRKYCKKQKIDKEKEKEAKDIAGGNKGTRQQRRVEEAAERNRDVTVEAFWNEVTKKETQFQGMMGIGRRRQIDV